VASVTGTDMPAGVLLAFAVWCLEASGPDRPWRAAILFGLASGLTATVRAVAAPLAALSLLYWLALRVRPAPALARTAVSCLVAFLVLLPWGLRNQRRYDEFFLTDSHGGHTALVGANPNSDGVYSRSLNQLFWKGTGHKLFDSPHRESDQAAYALAKSWARFEPAYAAALVMAKADRLLTNERPLLYWPVYRQGVLTGGLRAWFDRHRAGLDRVVDGFWYALVGLAAVGVVLAVSRRRWPALALLVFPLALVGLYATFFSEVRYHLAIAIFLFPFAGLALTGLGEGGSRRRLRAEVTVAMAIVVAVFVGWPALVRGAAAVRDRHRWGVAVCEAAGAPTLCRWKATTPAPGHGPSPVRGVWNGVGLIPAAPGGTVAAQTELELPPGQFQVAVIADTVAADADQGAVRLTLEAEGQTIGQQVFPVNAPPLDRLISGMVVHASGPLRVRAVVETLSPPADQGKPPVIWLSNLSVTGRATEEIKR
jgi:hypothetical protein